MNARQTRKSIVSEERRAGRKYPDPLRADDLCDCGKERQEHEGPDGWGPCLGQGCLKFRDCGG